tara:strand:- start:47112 stop:47705 length:594 start_codon:yes stop_codon:yes gene_type:complete
MAQLPKKHVNKAKKQVFKKTGFLYAILSGYGLKDKHINLMVLLFFILAFFNFHLFAVTNLSFYGLSKLLAVVLALCFLFLMWVNKYLALTSSFWQPRMVLLLLVPALSFLIFAFNYVLPIDERITVFDVRIKRHGAFELEHSSGVEFTFTEERVYNLSESDVDGLKVYSPQWIRIKEQKGIFGMWVVTSAEAIYSDD